MLDFSSGVGSDRAAQRDARALLARLVRSNRGVLTGAILVAIVLPELLHPAIAANFYWARYVRFGDFDQPEILMSFLALLSAHASLQKVNSLPLVGDKIVVVPTFIMTYGCAVVFLGFVLREFGRYHFVTSFFIGIAWYLFVSMWRARTFVPKIAIVGSAPKDQILRNSRVDWVSLHEAKLPPSISGIVFDKTREVPAEFERLFARAVLRQIPVFELSSFRELMTGRVQLGLRPEEAFGAIRPSRPYIRAKRVLAVITGIVALALVAPVMLLCAVAIRLESPGPALYRQRRIGYKGRRFTCYKLRSMRTGVSGSQYTEENDPRITRFGRFLRRTRFDELPQIVNIIRGEMCWIGPRPESVPLARMYERAIPYYGYRHVVRPGITGWAAVHQGNVGLSDAALRKLEFDFYYIKHCSLWLDFLIVLMTARTVITGFGAR